MSLAHFCPRWRERGWEGGDLKETRGESWFPFFFILSTQHGASLPLPQTAVCMSRLILQDKDGDGGPGRAALPLLPAITQSFVGKSEFEERPDIVCQD